MSRRVNLRAEHEGRNARYLDAYLDGGDLHIDGQDLGPGTASISSDGEYEWFQVIPRAHVPRLKNLLGAKPDEDILDVLERDWTGKRAGDLERILRESDIPIAFSSWSG